MLPALIRKCHDAKRARRKEVVIWGTGSPKREFLHVDDLADACLFLMRNYDDEPHINVGTGEDLTIRELAETVRDIVHPDAELIFDTTKPDGSPRKLLDVTRLHDLGWRHTIPLHEGIASSYQWYLDESGRLSTLLEVGPNEQIANCELRITNLSLPSTNLPGNAKPRAVPSFWYAEGGIEPNNSIVRKEVNVRPEDTTPESESTVGRRAFAFAIEIVKL